MGSTTEAQRAARRREVAKRLRLGESYAEIADALDVAKSTVSRDVRKLREQWREEASGDMDEHLSRRLAELKAIKREAFAAWLDSREGATREKVRTEGAGQSVTSVGEDGGLDTEAAVTDVEEVTKEVTRVAGGDAKHLKIMLDAEKEIQKLLGVHDYDGESEGGRLDSLVNVIERTAEEYDPQQFEDEEIR
jgi:transposase